jgi:dipeptidase E
VGIMLFSNQNWDKFNKEIQIYLSHELQNKKIIYVPSRSDSQRKYYNQTKEFYSNCGIKELLYLDVDEEFDPNLLENLNCYDAIHLSGGQTSYFYKMIKKRGFDKTIKDFFLSGKMLIGMSAGAIIMGKSTKTATLLENDVVENDKGLCLFNFEIFPHYTKQKESIITEYICKYPDKIVYGLPDESLIHLKENNVKLLGDIYIYSSQVFNT